MDKNESLDLAGKADFISGIYNYCDRWCERCPFTSRCFLFAQEQMDPELGDPKVRDIRNEKFWRKLSAILSNTTAMITEWAEEAGIRLDAIDATDDLAAHTREMTEAKQHELSLAAQHYAEMSENWFNEEWLTTEDVHCDAAIGSEPDEDDLTISNAAEVIHWYQFFIAAKISRALMGIDRIEPNQEVDENELLGSNLFEVQPDVAADYDAILAKTDRMDANGSAKVALIALDRSISAWRVLQTSLPEKVASIAPMLIELERLRRSTESTFPRARDFIRPGLDESTSEFLS